MVTSQSSFESLSSNSCCACWVCWLFSALCDAGLARQATCSRSYDWTHCAAECTSCTCRRWPRLFCRCACCHLGTAAGFSGYAFCHWHTSTPGSSSCSSTLFHSLLRSSWGAAARASTHPRTPAPSEGWCWCTGHQRCIWWNAVLGNPLEPELQEAEKKVHQKHKQMDFFLQGICNNKNMQMIANCQIEREHLFYFHNAKIWL